MILPLIVVFLVASVISYLGILALRKWILRKRILDIPNQRSSHTIPTPRGGGLVIVILVMVAVLVLTIVNQAWQQGLIILIAGALIAQVGWWDDQHSLSAPMRLLLQSIAAITVIAGLGYFRSITFPVLGTLEVGWAGIPITFLWIIGLINAYNFMDGIDGLAGGVAVAAGLGWVAVSLGGGFGPRSNPLWMGLVIAAGSLGFLVHNWAPAKIFMGDVASTFLGFCFAVLPLLAANLEGKSLMVGTILLWTFILDTLITFIIRAIRREKVLSAHRSHLYQRMTLTGWKPYAVSLLYIFLTLLGAILAIGWEGDSPIFAYLILIGLPLLWLLLWIVTFLREKKKGLSS